MRDYIIADNQDITKSGILFLLGRMKEIGNITEIESKTDLIKILKEKPESVVIIDYTLFDFSSINELLILNERFPTISWLLFSDELSEEFLRSILFSSKAFSVVMKDSSKEEIITALHECHHNDRFICSHVGNLLLNNRPTHTNIDKTLTLTEQEILKEITFGKTTKEIAIERHLSFHTVNTHRKNIFRKLEVNNVHEAIKYAMRAGLIDIAEYYI